MSVSEPFIRRPVGTSLLAAGVLLLGAVAYHFLPVAPLPKVDFPTISVMRRSPASIPPRLRRLLPLRWSAVSPKSPALTKLLQSVR